MVADIQLLQGKVVTEPDSKKTKNISVLIQELALEILTDEEIAIAASPTSTVPFATKAIE